jgi:hypothetical protein
MKFITTSGVMYVITIYVALPHRHDVYLAKVGFLANAAAEKQLRSEAPQEESEEQHLLVPKQMIVQYLTTYNWQPWPRAGGDITYQN